MCVLRILHFQISYKFKFFITFHFLKYIKIHSLIICHDITSKTFALKIWVKVDFEIYADNESQKV